METAVISTENLNGVNVPVVQQLLADVRRDHLRDATHWAVTTSW
jgi:hypothetical protein